MFSKKIALLGKQDAQSLATLEATCFHSGWSADQYRIVLKSRIDFDYTAFHEKGTENKNPSPLLLKAFLQSQVPVLGLFIGGELSGYVSLRILGEESEIYNIGIIPTLRCKGLGSTLLGTCLYLAKHCAITSTFLEVRESNSVALALYKKMGFIPVGVRKNYYPDGESAMLMECTLDNIV